MKLLGHFWWMIQAKSGQRKPIKKKKVRAKGKSQNLGIVRCDEHTGVDLARGELSGRPNNTPDDAGGSENTGTGAPESVLLVTVAHSRNVGEHPGLDTELNG
jgi:hypothetical protein